MYCPNCGTNQKADQPGTCPKCKMPLLEAAELVAKHRAAMQEPVAEPGIPKERLIGAAAFLAIAAVPISLGVKSALERKP